MSLLWPGSVNVSPQERPEALSLKILHVHRNTGGLETEGSKETERYRIRFYSLLQICLLDLVSD